MKALILSLPIAAVLLLSGCGQEVVRPLDPADRQGSGAQHPDSSEQDRSDARSDSAQTGPFDGQPDIDSVPIEDRADRQPPIAVDPLADPNSILAERTIYFDFDSSRVAQRYLPLLNAHALYLAEYPNARVVVEGHADERGSREYNIGLGERRALNVRRRLLFQGASGNQLEVISLGEERPARAGSDEQAWAANRRVELVY